MIYNTMVLNERYKSYSNINQKINIEIKNKKLFRVVKGLYTDDFEHEQKVLANLIYGPSYLSFEYVLSYYCLIPELVKLYTSATFNKKNSKFYYVLDERYEYRNIPNDVYCYGVQTYKDDSNLPYRMATKEKALCDTLYFSIPIRSIKALKVLLFEDLRIDEEEFMKLNFDFIIDIAPLYHKNTLNILSKYLKEIKYGKSNNNII